MTVFLGGDVMTGRGIDQILPCPNSPELHESFVRDAGVYVELAEAASGPIPRPVDPASIWGDALAALERAAPAARIVNLETSVTSAAAPWPGKGVTYRMHPANIGCLTAAGLDVCALANNHVLDYGHAGLEETLATLARAGIRTAGAGRTLAEARRPAAVELGGGRRLLVFSVGAASSGVPSGWAATADRPGVDFLSDVDAAAADAVAARVQAARRPGDLAILSIHWGSNWGYEVEAAQRRFAHRVIEGGVDIVHGHSSHHPRPIEVYRDRLVLYGCGDLIDDYEGITGYEEYRDDLVLLYLATLAGDGALRALRLVPMRIRRMRLERVPAGDAEWLRERLDRVSAPFGCRVEATEDGALALRWRAE
ncbi:MAG TPA: CapA family protein [Candidatus Binatia bacterium]|nr:CapA family protein [Candidatus Binatia bacterium]